ncbi:MAG: substrate-binding domain-containing protein [Synergistaceae bacterium]|jgi:ribose transport system substrate-binding protein|nr:substrate-binding domain-containing protein [Synergistaceae bacterium]
MKKHGFRLLAVIAVVFSLLASGVSFAADSPFAGNADEVYYMVAFLSGHPFWVGCRLGAEAAAQQLGVTLKYGGDPEYDEVKSVAAFEQIVATKPAGVFVTCINPDALLGPINNAVDSGIPVITFDSDSPDSKRLSYVSTDNSYLGTFLMDYVATNLLPGGKGTVGLIGRPNQFNIRQRTDAFQARAKERYPDARVLDLVDGKGEITESAAACSAMLQANPDITVIFAADGQSAAGAVQACKEAGKSDIKIMTVDQDPGLLDQIKAGELYGTVAQNQFNMGYWAMMEMYAYVHGLVSPFNNWQAEKISPLPPYINSGVDIVTKDNADAFYVPGTTK